MKMTLDEKKQLKEAIVKYEIEIRNNIYNSKYLQYYPKLLIAEELGCTFLYSNKERVYDDITKVEKIYIECTIYKNDKKIGNSFAECSNQETFYSDKDSFAILGGVQTRALSRAINNAIPTLIRMINYYVKDLNLDFLSAEEMRNDLKKAKEIKAKKAEVIKSEVINNNNYYMVNSGDNTIKGIQNKLVKFLSAVKDSEMVKKYGDKLNKANEKYILNKNKSEYTNDLKTIIEDIGSSYFISEGDDKNGN